MPPPTKGCRGGSSCPSRGAAHVPAHLRAAGRAAHAPAKQKQQACQPLAQGGMVGHEQEKLEPPPAVQEEGRFTLTINNGGLQGWRLTHPPHLRDYYLG